MDDNDTITLGQTIADAYAEAGNRDEQFNELLMYVAHLENVERDIERRTPLATAIRRHTNA